MSEVAAAEARNVHDVLAPIIEEIYARLAQDNPVMLTEIRDRVEAGFVQAGYRAKRPAGWQRRVLVVRLDEIGDNVLNSAFLRGLRALYPDARIDLLVKPSVYPLMEHCPYVDEVLHVQMARSMQLGDLYFWAYRLSDEVLWARQYDACIVPRWDTDETWSSLLALFSGARERIGYSEHVSPLKAKICEGMNTFLTQAFLTPPHVVHEVEKGMYLLRLLGVEHPDGKLELWLSSADVAEAKALLAKAGRGRAVAVAVATREGRKTYPPTLLAKALGELADLDVTFYLLGGPEDAEAAAVVEHALPAGRTVNLAGRTRLPVSAAVVALSSLYMGGDTGMTHVAAAAGRPVVEWFCHPMDTVVSVNSLYARFYPWRVPAIVLRPEHAIGACTEKPDVFEEIAGCHSRSDAHCIQTIDPHYIALAARRFLS